MVHDAAAIRARKRLYMTATSRLYSPAAKKKAEAADAYVATVDDEETYGPELHRLNFADSVERDLLSDYKVAILVMSEEQVAREYQAELADSEGLKVGDVGRVVECLNGLAKLDPEQGQFKDDPKPMQRAVAFRTPSRRRSVSSNLSACYRTMRVMPSVSFRSRRNTSTARAAYSCVPAGWRGWAPRACTSSTRSRELGLSSCGCSSSV